MSTSTIERPDIDALVAPIEAADGQPYRVKQRAIWAASKMLRNDWFAHQDLSEQEVINRLYAIDAAAWVIGIPHGTRDNVMFTTYNCVTSSAWAHSTLTLKPIMDGADINGAGPDGVGGYSGVVSAVPRHV